MKMFSSTSTVFLSVMPYIYRWVPYARGGRGAGRGAGRGGGLSGGLKEGICQVNWSVLTLVYPMYLHSILQILSKAQRGKIEAEKKVLEMERDKVSDRKSIWLSFIGLLPGNQGVTRLPRGERPGSWDAGGGERFADWHQNAPGGTWFRWWLGICTTSLPCIKQTSHSHSQRKFINLIFFSMKYNFISLDLRVIISTDCFYQIDDVEGYKT